MKKKIWDILDTKITWKMICYWVIYPVITFFGTWQFLFACLCFAKFISGSPIWCVYLFPLAWGCTITLAILLCIAIQATILYDKFIKNKITKNDQKKIKRLKYIFGYEYASDIACILMYIKRNNINDTFEEFYHKSINEYNKFIIGCIITELSDAKKDDENSFLKVIRQRYDNYKSGKFELDKKIYINSKIFDEQEWV